MDTYDDRPISVYDNLNMPSAMHTSTPKSQQKPSQSQLQSLVTTNGNANHQSPYAEISFKFDENNRKQQQQQQYPQIVSNGNPGLNVKQVHPLEQNIKQIQSNTPYYSTPFKPTMSTMSTITPNDLQLSAAALTKPAVSPTGIVNKTPLAPFQHQPQQQHLTNPPQPLAATTSLSSALNSTTVQNAFPAARPLSQHSQSELNESIAAVKAALNDAKSKFFGLNGYSPNSNENLSNKLSPEISASSASTAGTNESPIFLDLLPQSESEQNPNFNKTQAFPPAPLAQAQSQSQSQPQPPPKPQPKYQNIPENSAIFRNHQNQPPELPPKPSHLSPSQYSGSSPNTSASPNSTASLSPSPDRIVNTTTPNSSNMPLGSYSGPLNGGDPIGATSTAKLLPHATYRQIPLNDIDGTHPSQAVYMTTTVPQNIKGSKIAGRHTPTRNSLRHSRMLVVNNKNYQGADFPNPLNFKRQNIARWLLILEILIGILLLCLTVWIFLLAPNTAIQDNPYWSGLILVLSGILGLSIIRFQRNKRRKLREHCFSFWRANSYVISLLAVLLCCIALICATIHFVRLTSSDTKCASTNALLEHGSCTCTFNAHRIPEETNDDSNNNPVDMEDYSYTYEYRDLSCQELTGEWTTILGLSMALNALGMLVGLSYISMLVCCRYDSKRFYSSVQTSTF